ncbi:MAG: inosine/xanthosine triphosphatase [Candidatus Aenigmatarchaeota archaeon]|nr:inosine/xanthosine triphosphatase [Candidatus Aenigmarchaeota archaeon]
MKVAVGSKNPIKIKAVENVFKKVFKDVEIVSCEVNSEVSHTPASLKEVTKGAINRAKNALKIANADIGVGLEGGWEKTEFGDFLCGAVAIIDKKGRVGISREQSILLPEKIVKELEKGKELGKIMDEIQRIENTKQKWGAVGFFTKNLINRQKAFEKSILFALARFLREEFYEK